MGRSSNPSGARSGRNALRAEAGHDLPIADSVFPETHDPGAGLGGSASHDLVPAGLDARGDPVRQILDNRGYFSYPDFKKEFDCSA